MWYVIFMYPYLLKGLKREWADHVVYTRFLMQDCSEVETVGLDTPRRKTSKALVLIETPQDRQRRHKLKEACNLEAENGLKKEEERYLRENEKFTFEFKRFFLLFIN